MTRFVSCPVHVRSADLGTVAVLVDLSTGRVEVLLGWARRAWCALARNGNCSAAAAATGVTIDQVHVMVDELVTGGMLDAAPRPRSWVVPVAPPTVPSWGTGEVPAATSPRRTIGVTAAALAAVALIAVLVTRGPVDDRQSFARIARLIAAVAVRSRHDADRRMVTDALDAVRTVASVLPFRVACLEETAAATVVLALHGRRAVWCHGVAADPIRLHSWMTLDGRAVAEPAGTARYTPLLRIPAHTDDSA